MGSRPAQNKNEMPVAQTILLANRVGYQDGAVVSRTLINRATGTLTLFAFDEGQGSSEHMLASIASKTAAFKAAG